MFCSTVIPTVNRPSLERAVESVLHQTHDSDEFEVIVVNDSGYRLPPAKWQSSNQVRIINTSRRNRSVARNAGAAIALGRYLHFLDDDDWMLPKAFDHLRRAAQDSGAAWTFGGFRLVDNSGETIQEVFPQLKGNCFVQIMASEWLPLQASFIRTDAFWEVNGFAPLPSLLGGYEDIDLCRQVTARGSVVGETALVASIRVGDQSSTTDYANMFRQNRESREKALTQPKAFSRMREAAVCDYWHGRIVYYYFASVAWNWRQQRLLTGFGRAIYGVMAAVLAGRNLFSTDFWRGVTRPHISLVRKTIEASGRNLYRETMWK